MKIYQFYRPLFTIGILCLSLYSYGQQVLGDFTGNDQSEWPKVVWYRDTGNNWDEGLLKNSSTQSSVFGRAGYGIHMHESRQFTFWSSGWNPLFAIEGGTGNAYLKGKVGIGITAPQANLHIQSNGSSVNTTDEYSGNLIIQGNPGSRSTTSGASLEFVIPANADGSNPWGQGRIITVAGNGNTYNAVGKMILGTRRMFDKGSGPNLWNYGDDIVIDGAGHVGINTLTPREALSVNGNIRSKEVKVETANWPDYVFKPAYRLKSLAEIKLFIDQNHHLPETPTEAEITKDGQNLGEMNKLLLKKVEELTLYLFDLKKDNEVLEARVKKLETVK